MSSSHSSLTPLAFAASGWLDALSVPIDVDVLSLWIRPHPAVLEDARQRGLQLSPGERSLLEQLSQFTPGDDAEVLTSVGYHLRLLDGALRNDPDPKRSAEYAAYVEQAALLAAAMAHGVLAAFHLRSERWTDDRDAPLPPAFVHHAANCLHHYHRAWPLSSPVVTSFGGSPFRRSPGDDEATAAVKRILRNHQQIVGPRVTTADLLLLQHLLKYLLGSAPAPASGPGENDDGSYRVDVPLLAASSDGGGAIDRGTLVAAPSCWEGCYLDPVAFGLMLLDARFRDAIDIGWRCCRADLRLNRPEHAPPLAVRVSVETTGSGSVLLEGASAGGILACGMLAAAKRRLINVRHSGTFCLRLRSLKRDPPDDGDGDPGSHATNRGASTYDLDADDVSLGFVNAISLPWKLAAAGTTDPDQRPAALARVLVAQGQALDDRRREKPWDEWAPEERRRFHLRIDPVGTLAEAFHELMGDARIEDVVARQAEQAVLDWAWMRQGKPSPRGGENHQLDIYVEPHIAVLDEEGPAEDTTERPSPRPEDEDQPQHDRYIRLDFGIDELIERWLLAEDRWIVLTEDAGAGKTVFTWRLRERLATWGPRPFLVLRFEGSWPSDVRAALRKAVANDCGDDVTPQILIDYLLEQRRVVLLFDALDQAGDEALANLDRTLRGNEDGQLVDQLRVIVTSRAYKVRERQGNLFRSDRWQPARIELFDEGQQAAYQAKFAELYPERASLWDVLVPDRELVADLLRFPVALRMVREILQRARPDGSNLVPFRNRGDLYWTTAIGLISRAFRTQGRAENVDDVPLLVEAIACIAIQMMLTTRNEHGYVVPRARIGETMRGARRRFSGSEEEWSRCRGFLNDTLLTDRCLFEALDEQNLSFRSLKMLEFFAGLYVSRFARDGIVAELLPFVGSEQWHWPWRFAIEMAELRTGDRAAAHDSVALARSLIALLSRPKNFPRPSELIWIAWPWLLEQAALFTAPPESECKKWSPRYEKPLDAATYRVQIAVREVVEAAKGHLTDEAARQGELRRRLVLGRATGRFPAADLALDALYAFLSEYPRILQGESAIERLSAAEAQALGRRYEAGYKRCPKPASEAEWQEMCEAAAAGRPHPLLRGWMGDDSRLKPEWSIELVHEAPLGPPFLLHEFPMTNDVYALFDAWHEDRVRTKGHSEFSPHPRYPVIDTDWHDAWACSLWVGGRLPDEVEWEIASRAQRWNGEVAPPRTLFWFGITTEDAARMTDEQIAAALAPHVWFDANCTEEQDGFHSQHVGKEGHSNGWGLGDMLGNVWEWCRNWYAVDPRSRRIASTRSSYRVFRGGGWDDVARDCRSAFSNWSVPECRNSHIGFRVAEVR